MKSTTLGGVHVFRGADPVEFAWGSLQRFRNASFCFDRLVKFQNVPASQERNAKKQAKQIGDALRLAQEYFNASKAVSLSTKPLLLYYCIMNLAIAEFLFKQDGRSSLDYARAEHKHHGLTFSLNSNPKTTDAIEEAAGLLTAKPTLFGEDARRGTFELWHRSAREYPLVGEIKDKRNSTSQYGLVLQGSSERLPVVPSEGIDLLSVIRMIPSLMFIIAPLDVKTEFIRARFWVEIEDDFTKIMGFSHPAPSETLKNCMDRIAFSPNTVQCVDVVELVGGFRISIKFRPGEPLDFHTPMVANISKDDILMYSKESSVNEFGAYYLAFFILGNLVRYYPDVWMPHVDEHSPLAVLVEFLCSEFERRVPILMLSELERDLIVTP